MNKSTTSPHFPTIRVNLLRAHGSPKGYWHSKGCRCVACRGARSAYSAAYYAARREEHAKRSAAYQISHRVEIAAQRAQYRAAHPKEEAARSAAYRATHRDEKSATDAAYYAAHSEKLRAYQAAYQAAHPEETAARHAAYHAAHPEEAAARSRSRKALVRNAAGTHTAADVRAQYDRQRGRCYWCGVKVALRKKHVDHVMPIILGGSNGPENIVIACAHCNLSKKASHPMDFAGVLC